MSSPARAARTAPFAGVSFLPAPSQAPRCLARLRRYLDQRASLSPDEVLGSFLGLALPAAAFHLTGIDHVAAYLGDYRREEEVEAWQGCLEASPEVTGLQSGPSHIAPRHYGTPGHWMTCRLDGAAVEMFSCKHAGPWRELAPRRRRDLMSHFALGVEGPEHVEPLLTYFSHYPGVELLCFNAEDEVGHTYGHLRSRGRVLELVYNPRGAAG
jgi:hypothetical protein